MSRTIPEVRRHLEFMAENVGVKIVPEDIPYLKQAAELLKAGDLPPLKHDVGHNDR